MANEIVTGANGEDPEKWIVKRRGKWISTRPGKYVTLVTVEFLHQFKAGQKIRIPQLAKLHFGMAYDWACVRVNQRLWKAVQILQDQGFPWYSAYDRSNFGRKSWIKFYAGDDEDKVHYPIYRKMIKDRHERADERLAVLDRLIPA